MPPTSPIRILVRHTAPLTQAGISSALQAFPGFEVIHRAPAESWASVDAVDVLAADFQSAMDYLASAPAKGAQPKVLVVTTSERECDIRRALKQGVRGYVLQGCSIDDLATAVQQISLGHVHLGSSVAQRLAESICGNALTAREEEVLQCVIDGECNKEIARRMALSVGTVKSHLRAVYAKLEVKSRTHAVAEASRRGLLRRAPVAAPVVAPPMPAGLHPARESFTHADA